MSRLTRRTFLSSTAAGVAAATALRPSAASARIQGANDRVRVAVIGTGRQGISDMRNHMTLADVEIAAVCDVYGANLAKAAALAPKAAQVKDFRAVLDDKDIDAVIIGTPDHWHALMTVMACQAGKDVYVEKPTSVAIAEGRKMVEAARKYNRVVQVGTQQRSAKHFQQAAKARAGRRHRQSRRASAAGTSATSFPTASATRPTAIRRPISDWDLWLGPAPKRPFNANRFGVVPTNFSYFRWFWDYAGGMMTDWGVHLIDIVQMAMKVDAPTGVSAVGGKFVLADNRETPDTILASYQYPGFVMTYENRTTNGRALNDHNYGIEFYGTDGTLFVDRGGFELTPETRRDGDQVVDRTLARRQASTPDNPSHARNFIDCVKSRQKPICDIEIGHRSTTTAILGNLALRSGASLTWDGATEKVTNGNQKAAALVDVAYRAPWKLAV